MKRERQNNKGFTLLELIVSIAIIAVLTGMLVPQFFQYIERAREARDMQTMRSIYTVVQVAAVDEAAYDSLCEAAGVRLSNDDGAEWTYCSTLEDLLQQGAFGKTVSDLLGTSEGDELISKKAGNGVVCVRISDTETGLKISVYSGTEGAPDKRVGTLECLGADWK